VKNSSENQSIALIAARGSVGSANAARTAIGGSSRMNCTSPGCAAAPAARTARPGTTAAASRGARRMPRHDSHAKAAIGQTGHENRKKLRAMKPAAASEGGP
jgi:hypothetical protein